MTARNLEKIFDPQNIAVIGASNTKNSVGYIIFNNLISSGYKGIVFPVNPKYKSVQGVRAFSSVSDLPENVDLAVIATPAIVVKSGRAAQGAKAATSHTGALAGEDDVYQAAFDRVGIVRVDEISDLFDCAEVLAAQPMLEGNRVTIITNAGGPGVMATDSLTKAGGELAELSKQTREKLDEVLPTYCLTIQK
jgi:acetyltransferase